MRQRNSLPRFSVAGFALLVLMSSSVSYKNALQGILAKLTSYTKSFPTEKIYIHLDRPLYAPGEDIWFCSYVVNAVDPSITLSEIVYVELLTGEGSVLDRKVLHVKDGFVIGDFKLKKSLTNGSYIVRGYTNYQKNFDESWLSQKVVRIQSGEVVNHVNPEKDLKVKIDLKFFPEGGTFLAGVENRVALKATNERGEVGRFNAGIRENIIPEEANFSGTIRTLDTMMRKDIHERIIRTATKIAESAGATAEVKMVPQEPMMFNDPALTERMVPGLQRAVRKPGDLKTDRAGTGAEDFSYFQQKVPGLYFSVGARPSDDSLVGSHHTPDFYIDEKGFIFGLKAMLNVTVDYMYLRP